jgi:hypothetical protein
VKCSESARTSAPPGLGAEDVAGQRQQFLGRDRRRARRGARGETDRLAGIGVEREESLGGLGGPFPIVVTVGAHVPLAEAAHAMRIDRQQPAPEVARGAADLAEGRLKAQTVGDGAGAEELVDGHVAGEKRQAVGQLEDPLVQGTAVP